MRSLVVLGLIFSAAASAQVTGSITGSVTDPSGSAVPKAKVSVFLAGGSRAVTETQTTSEGLFSIQSIRPELYDLTVEAPGFVVYKLRNVKVDPSRPTDLPPLKLEVASTRTSIDVTAGAETVQVTSPEVSTTVTVDQIRDLPILDRGPLGFITTQAGVAPTQFETDINGQRSSFSSVTLDGINIQDNYIRTGGLDFLPNQLYLNQVKEFSVNTSNMGSVESGASQVNFSTPSGTNQFHGDLLWQNRNNSTAANDFFDNSDGIRLPRLNLNQGGGSIGGPIKKDRLFFYTNYEFYRLSSQSSMDQTILTASARQGIFKYVDNNGQVQQANVLNIVGLQPDPVMAANLAKVPGPQNINNFRVGDSQPGQLLNTAGYSFLVRNNVVEDNVTARGDYYVSAQHSVSAAFAWNREFVDRPDLGVGYGTIPPIGQNNSSKFLSLNWRYSPTGSFTNEVRAGFNLAPAALTNSEQLPAYLVGGTIWSSPSATAASGFLPQGRDTRTYSVQDNANWVHGRHTVSFGFQTQLVYVRNYDYAGTVPFYNVGITSVNQQNNLLFSTDLPGINSNQLNNANLLLASLAGLVDNANETYNVTSRTSGFVPGAPYLRHWTFNNFAFYGMDQWKLGKRLTATAGVRWDYYAPPNERDSLEVQPALVNGDARTTLLNPDATLNFAGNSVGHPFYNKDLNNFAPNVGLAWDVFGNGKTSMRAGYGIHYVNDENLVVTEGYTFQNPGLQGYNYRYDLSGFMSGPLPPLPAPAFQVPLTFAQGYAENPEVFYGMMDPGLRTPYVQEWNFTIEHNFKGNIIDARYLGNHATKLLRGFNYNQEDITSNGFLSDFLKAQNNGNLALAQTGAFSPAYNPRIAGSQPLTVFAKLYKGGQLTDPTYKQLIQQGQAGELAFEYQVAGDNGSLSFFPNPNALETDFVTNYSNSVYDALQLETRRRLKNGISYQVNYTFSKWLSDAPGTDQYRYQPFLDINNPRLERSRTPTDLTHQFKANYVYDLPFGPGHRLTKKGWDKALAGWKTSSIISWVSGNPFSIYSGYGTTLAGYTSGTNEAVTSLNKAQLDNLLQFHITGNGPYMVAASAIGPDGRGAVANQGQTPFTGEVFSNPGAGQVGTLQKDLFTGPSVFNMDAAVIKQTQLREHLIAEIRVEALNVFNHPTFAMFDQSIDQQQFGKVTSEATMPRRLQFGVTLFF